MLIYSSREIFLQFESLLNSCLTRGKAKTGECTIANAWNIVGNIFAAMVAELDDGVGRVMEALSSAGIAENTLTIFSTGALLGVEESTSHKRETVWSKNTTHALFRAT